VLKDDDGAIVEGSGVIAHRVDSGIEGGGDGSTGFDEEINAEMDGTALGEGIVYVAEKLRGVEWAGLVVAADAGRSICQVQDGFQLL